MIQDLTYKIYQLEREANKVASQKNIPDDQRPKHNADYIRERLWPEEVMFFETLKPNSYEGQQRKD
jgi:hypothetical protein